VRALHVGLHSALTSRAQVAATGRMRRTFVTSATLVLVIFVLAQFARAQDEDCPKASPAAASRSNAAGDPTSGQNASLSTRPKSRHRV
jgi:hypothetical protein